MDRDRQLAGGFTDLGDGWNVKQTEESEGGPGRSGYDIAGNRNSKH